MKTGNILVEQVVKEGYVIEAYDESLSPSEILKEIKETFPNITTYASDPKIILGEHNGHKFAIRCKNVTYLGNPHPHYKKRIQISDDLFHFYNTAVSLDAKPILLGIYKCGDNVIFVDFKIDTYINKTAHNSSAHIYVSDLAAATVDGYFQKIDYFDNTITAIRPDMVNVYLNDLFEGDRETIAERPSESELGEKESTSGLENSPVVNNAQKYELPELVSLLAHQADGHEKDIDTYVATYPEVFKSDIVPKIRDFFEDEDKEWYGIDCYKKMIAANYRNKYQPEWVGFFLEYEFEKYLADNHLHYLITYAQDKKDGGIDLDLFFPTIESYGDLKAHSEESRGIQGNDWNTIFGIISGQDEKSHIYYIVCEHSTEKDSLYDYEVTKFWNTTLKKSDIMSYSSRMKNNVRLKRMYILDINYSNKEYLTQFRQGINSDGKPRAPKIMIEQDNLGHFIIDEMTL